ncbi:hypothetical protein [Streptomyces sp. NPDC048436]|uniref:hypothetical protein n=1 Tax=Streptomyces sp. NPDC048436 TaxID=3365550 RepID=UPI003724BC0B
MPIDPYAALHAMLRAEAVRNSPVHSDPTPTQTDEEDNKPTHQENQRPETS